MHPTWLHYLRGTNSLLADASHRRSRASVGAIGRQCEQAGIPAIGVAATLTTSRPSGRGRWRAAACRSAARLGRSASVSCRATAHAALTCITTSRPSGRGRWRAAACRPAARLGHSASVSCRATVYRLALCQGRPAGPGAGGGGRMVVWLLDDFPWHGPATVQRR